MKRTRHLSLAWLGVAIIVAACQSPTPRPSGGLSPSSVTTAYRPDAVVPPPGLDADQLTPLTGADADQARLPLEEVVALTPKPKPLARPAATDPITAAVVEAGPPLAAQRAYAAGRAAWKDGDNFGAIRQLQSALRLAPGSPQVLRLLGRIFGETGNKVRAAVYLEQAAALDPQEPTTLYLLGRYALEQHQDDAAIAYFAAAQDAINAAGDGSDVDPVLPILIHHYLGSALRNAGYAHAASDQFNAFLEAPRERFRDTRLSRELLFLDQQRGAVYVVLGDQHHQLGDPEAALAAYEKTAEMGFSDRLGLVRRLVYTYLRLGHPDRARQIVLNRIADAADDPQTLRLVSYLADQGLDPGEIAAQLQRVYRDSDQSAAMVLALSELVPDEEGLAMLADHLRTRPGDQAVFEELVRRGTVEKPLDPAMMTDLLLLTADAMAGAPQNARAYAGFFLANAGRLDDVIFALDAVFEDAAHPDMLLALKGVGLATNARMDDAIAVFQQAIQAEPENDLPRLELTKIMVIRRDFEQAQRLLEPLADRNDADVIQLRVRVLKETGRQAEALALLDRMLRSGDAPARLTLEKARLQVQMQDIEGAEQTLLDALNRSPNEEAVYAALFEIYETAPDATRKYQRLMRRMLGAIPQSRIARLKRAEWLIIRRDFGQSEALLNELLKENANDLKAIAALLDLYASSDRRERADALIDQKLAENPANFPLLRVAHQFYTRVRDREKLLEMEERMLMLESPSAARTENLGRLYLVTQRPELAAELLRQAIDDDQTQATDSMIVLLWQALMQLERIDEALALLEEQFDAGRLDNPEAFVQLRWQTLWNAERFDEAEAVIKAAMDQFPDQAADFGYDWAVLVTMRGERGRAEQIMTELIERFPDHPGINNDLAYTWTVQNRNLERALEMTRRAVDAEPDNAAYLDSLGWVLYKLGRFDEAVVRLRQAMAAAQVAAQQAQRENQQVDTATLAVVGDHLGDALYRAGKTKQAIKTWREAREVTPEGVEDESSDLYQLADRLQEKVDAAEAGRPAPVADAPGADEAPMDPDPAAAADPAQNP